MSLLVSAQSNVRAVVSQPLSHGIVASAAHQVTRRLGRSLTAVANTAQDVATRQLTAVVGERITSAASLLLLDSTAPYLRPIAFVAEMVGKQLGMPGLGAIFTNRVVYNAAAWLQAPVDRLTRTLRWIYAHKGRVLLVVLGFGYAALVGMVVAVVVRVLLTTFYASNPWEHLGTIMSELAGIPRAIRLLKDRSEQARRQQNRRNLQRDIERLGELPDGQIIRNVFECFEHERAIEAGTTQALMAEALVGWPAELLVEWRVGVPDVDGVMTGGDNRPAVVDNGAILAFNDVRHGAMVHRRRALRCQACRGLRAIVRQTDATGPNNTADPDDFVLDAEVPDDGNDADATISAFLHQHNPIVPPQAPPAAPVAAVAAPDPGAGNAAPAPAPAPPAPVPVWPDIPLASLHSAITVPWSTPNPANSEPCPHRAEAWNGSPRDAAVEALHYLASVFPMSACRATLATQFALNNAAARFLRSAGMLPGPLSVAQEACVQA